jgi:hypothetical protein
LLQYVSFLWNFYFNVLLVFARNEAISFFYFTILFWACPSGSGYPLLVLALPSSGCGLTASIPHAAIGFKTIFFTISIIVYEMIFSFATNMLFLRNILILVQPARFSKPCRFLFPFCLFYIFTSYTCIIYIIFSFSKTCFD